MPIEPTSTEETAALLVGPDGRRTAVVVPLEGLIWAGTDPGAAGPGAFRAAPTVLAGRLAGSQGAALDPTGAPLLALERPTLRGIDLVHQVVLAAWVAAGWRQFAVTDPTQVAALSPVLATTDRSVLIAYAGADRTSGAPSPLLDPAFDVHLSTLQDGRLDRETVLAGPAPEAPLAIAVDPAGEIDLLVGAWTRKAPGFVLTGLRLLHRSQVGWQSEALPAVGGSSTAGVSRGWLVIDDSGTRHVLLETVRVAPGPAASSTFATDLYYLVRRSPGETPVSVLIAQQAIGRGIVADRDGIPRILLARTAGPTAGRPSIASVRAGSGHVDLIPGVSARFRAEAIALDPSGLLRVLVGRRPSADQLEIFEVVGRPD